MIAEQFRTQIISGELRPGERLPRQDLLAAELGVSLAVVREALRLLEVQDLITVHRGKTGGASVRLPSSGVVSSRLATVAASAGISPEDFRTTLAALDALCAHLCAALPDRSDTVVALHTLLEEPTGDPAADCRRFHQKIAHSCGLATMAMVVDAVAEAARAQSPEILRGCEVAATRSPAGARRVRVDHKRALAAIADGDSEAAALAAAHKARVTRATQRGGKQR